MVCYDGWFVGWLVRRSVWHIFLTLNLSSYLCLEKKSAKYTISTTYMLDICNDFAYLNILLKWLIWQIRNCLANEPFHKNTTYIDDELRNEEIWFGNWDEEGVCYVSNGLMRSIRMAKKVEGWWRGGGGRGRWEKVIEFSNSCQDTEYIEGGGEGGEDD